MTITAAMDNPLRVQKRKAVTPAESIPKKSHRSPTPIEDDSVGSGLSDSYDDFQLDQDEEPPSTAPTPLSPVSSKPSPKYPSQLKTQACPYPDCPKTFNRRAKLNEHLHSHTNTRPYKCPHAPCTKDFLRDTHLKHHIKSAHSEVRDYVCAYDGCGKVFVTGTRLKRHHAAHEGRDEFACKANGCGQTFRKHATLQKHTASVHEGKPHFVCEELTENGKTCGVGFETAGKLKTHQGRTHGSNRFWCTLCNTSKDQLDHQNQSTEQGIAFPTYGELQAHNRSIHPPTCETCGTKCQTHKELNRHIEAQHGNLDPEARKLHVCPEPDCGHSFTRKGNLTVHIKTVHAAQKGFVCGALDPATLNRVNGWSGTDACGRAFTTKSNLEEHVRTVHLGLDHSRKGKQKAKNSQAKKATAAGRLTGTAYEEAGHDIPCLRSECGFRFAREYDLDMHMQSKHGLADFEIQVLRAERDGVGLSTFGYGFAVDEEAGKSFEDGWGLDAYGAGAGEAGDMDFGDEERDFENELEEAATSGGEFWIGGRYEGNGDEWDREMEEMMMLVNEDRGDDDEQGDEMVIDPVLR